MVLGNGEPSYAILITGSKDHWRPVAQTAVWLTPDTTVLEGSSLWVDVILGRGRLTLPSIRSVGDRASQLDNGARGGEEWNDHVLRACDC